MRDLTATQLAGFLLLWTLGVAVVVDLAWCRPHRVARRHAEARARRHAATIHRLEHQAAVRGRAAHPAYQQPAQPCRPLRVVHDGEAG